MSVRTAYGARVRKTAKDPWVRVKTTVNPAGQWSLRRDAQIELDKLKRRGHVGHIVVLKITKVAGQPKVSTWLKGNVVPIADVAPQHRADYRDTLYRAARAAKAYGKPIQVNSSYRLYAEQVRLYNLYLAGRGPLAAVPGTSDHGRGLALDIQDARTTPKLIKALRAEGLVDTVPSETWHVRNMRRD